MEAVLLLQERREREWEWKGQTFLRAATVAVYFLPELETILSVRWFRDSGNPDSHFNEDERAASWVSPALTTDEDRQAFARKDADYWFRHTSLTDAHGGKLIENHSR